MKSFYIILSLIILSFSSCTEDKSKSQKETVVENKMTLNEELCVSFAYQLHESFVEDDATFLNQYILWDSIQKKSFLHFNIAETSTHEQLWDKLTSGLQLGNDFINILKNNGHIRFITYYTDDAKADTSHHIILRTFYPPQQINFYDFTLTTNENKLCIEDIYEYSNAVSLSNLLGEEVAYYSELNVPIDSVLSFVDTINIAKSTIMGYTTNGNLQNAYALFSKLPIALRQTKSYLQLEEQILFSSENSLVQEQFISKKLNLIPIQEKGRWLTAFYKHAIFGEYEDAAIALNNLEMEIGEDEFINFLKGVVHFEKRDYQNALIEFNTAIAGEPEVFVFHWNKVLTFLELEEYGKAVETLLVLDDYFSVSDINWDKEFIAYPMFLMSDAYEEWQSRIVS